MSGQTFGQKTQLTTRLREIIDAYSGAQMLNEMLQNADDAGSREFKVLLDVRTAPWGKEHMRFPRMSSWQGPALCAAHARPHRTLLAVTERRLSSAGTSLTTQSSSATT